jgi:hypothetical protein
MRSGVLPFPTKRQLVGLWPSGVSVCDLRSGAREYRRNKKQVVPTWEGTIQMFEEWLDQNRRTSIEIILSNSYVRTMILPWSGELHGDAEWSEFAMRRFCMTTGSTAGWDISLDRYRYGAPRLAFAMQSEQRALLLHRLSQCRVRTRSIQPHWVWAMNQYKGIDGRQIVVVLTEAESFSVVAIKDGHWAHARTFPGNGVTELTREIVNRERLILGFTRDTEILYIESGEGNENALLS